MGICAGIDLCDDHIAVAVCGCDDLSVYPAVICREKKSETWHIGEEAYRVALSGEGVLTDRLLRLLQKEGTSTIMRRQYSGVELVSQLIRKVLEENLTSADLTCVERLCIALHRPDPEMFAKVRQAAVCAGIPRERVVLISHEEAFVYYVLSREKELYAGLVGMFDLSGEHLCFYELMLQRGMGRSCVAAEGTDLEDAFHTDILRSDAGRTLGDHILTDVAKRCMEGKQYSALFVTGSGFDRVDWAPDFLRYVCTRKKVLQEKGLFAIGAALCADDEGKEPGGYPEYIFCDSRLSGEVSLGVEIHKRASRLILAKAGSRWNGLEAHAEVIPEAGEPLVITVEPFDRNKGKQEVQIPLSAFSELSERPDRCTRIGLDLRFSSAQTAELTLTDLGFGELYPASRETITKELRL